MTMRWMIALTVLVVLGISAVKFVDAREAEGLIAQAREAARGDENVRSADLFAQALRQNPWLRREILREYADQLLYSGRAAEAIPLFHETLETPRLSALDTERARRSLALAYLWSGNHTEAVAAYEEALQRKPSDSDLERNYVQALIGAARDLGRQDRNHEAVERFAAVIERVPERRAELLREYADQLTYSGRAAEAVALYNEVLAQPQLSETDLQNANRGLALAYLWSGNHEQAKAAYEQAMRLMPRDADMTKNYVEAIIGAARNAARRDQNRDAAERFATAISLAPNRRGELLREYADQLTFSGRAAVAVEYYLEIIATQADQPTDPQLLSALGLALLWSGQADAARQVYEEVVELLPEDADARKSLAEAVVAQARKAASQNENASSAALFARAIALSPDQRAEWLKEYADQLTYAQQADKAIQLYEEILSNSGLTGERSAEVRLAMALAQAWSGALAEALGEYDSLIAEDPANTRARLGRAEVLSWLHDHDAASSELSQILETDPEDDVARRRLARSESYRGRHRQAIALAKPLLQADPSDEDAAIIIAQAQRWMGRPDLAIITVEGLLAINPGSVRAQRLRTELMNDRRARSSFGTSYSDQSDDLGIARAGLRQSFSVNDGRTGFGPEVRYINYDPEGADGVDVVMVGGHFRHRFSDEVELNSAFFLNQQEGVNDETLFTHDSYITLYPDDAWRVDIGASRSTLDNITSLNQGLTVDTFSGSVDFWPASDIKLTGRAAWSDYSDGNARWWFQGEVLHQLISESPELWLGARYTRFAFEKQLANGYFNPEELQSIESTLKLSGVLLGKTVYELQGSAGYENANPGSGMFIWSAGLKLRHPIAKNVVLEATAAHSSSTLGSDSGFERTTVGLGLNVRW
ncbi:MAG: tetratricopeptide repeat protein [Paracoccaceae bacterium]|nr:tetratricopeptide repeat protein [Paracoccaceae bacterium]